MVSYQLKKLYLIKKMAQRRASFNSRFVLGLKNVLECQKNPVFSIPELEGRDLSQVSYDTLQKV